MDQTELDQIYAFKVALDNPSGEEDLETDNEVLTTNHGNKLKRSARYVSSRSIAAVPEDSVGVTVVDFNGTKQAVITQNEDGICDEVDLGAVLKPITDPTDVPTNESIAHTFESTLLSDMAKETLDIIVEEKVHATRISNLLSAFLGDDPKSLDLANLKVPEYSGNAENDIESFFAAPQKSADKSYGVPNEMAEEARQLLQIAHQRLEEFVHCMTSIRMGFTLANRKRRKVFNWCKELNGQDYVEEEVGPEEQITIGPMTTQQEVSASMTERSE